jgi:hypothetical protein
MSIILTRSQNQIITCSLTDKIFLSGPAGCGKTTVGVERLCYLLKQDTQADSILVLTPQRTLTIAYMEVLRGAQVSAGGQVNIATISGLARRMVDLFWPLAVETAGFKKPDKPPIFLTLETAQYYMAHIVRPLLEKGYFESVTIDRNRLYSQILDNLNKSAAVGFPYTEIGERLDSSWLGDQGQRRIYADAQDCANRFRNYCLEHNLLDFSLQMEVFWYILWPNQMVRAYLSGSYRHLIFDNIEEDTPRAHDLIHDWLPDFDSALLIYDEGGGYRHFLGADAESALALRELCSDQVTLDESFVTSPEVESLAVSLEKVITRSLIQSNQHATSNSKDKNSRKGQMEGAIKFSSTRFYPEMLDWVADEIRSLIMENQIPASEIVILAPYLSDALRFSIRNRLEAHGISVRSHRPSRSLRDEPAAQALLTLAALAHPGWDIRPTKFDLAYALMLAIEDMDLVRAHLLVEIVYRLRDFSLSPFEQIKPDVQERITYVMGERYTRVREWLEIYRTSEPATLDHFLRCLFGEVLSQPGFGFHRNLDAARVAANLVESVQKFRQVLEPVHADLSPNTRLPNNGPSAIGKEYITLLQDGVISAQYLEGWRTEPSEAVLIAPAYTFLMMNRPVSVQFWLEPGSSGWSERMYQPLTQPYVLSRHWPKDQPWTDADEVISSREALARLTSGLLRRCRSRVYLGISDLGESGFEQRGVLMKAFQRLLEFQVAL